MKSITDFDNLSPQEEVILENSKQGMETNLHIKRPSMPTDQNTVRAEFLRTMILDKSISSIIDPKGIRLQNAWITGKLDLSNIKVDFGLSFIGCVFEEIINIRDSELSTLILNNSLLQAGLTGDRVKINGSIFLKKSDSNHMIKMVSAQIYGNLNLHGLNIKTAQLQDKQYALYLNRSYVQGSIFLTDGFSCNQTSSLSNIKVNNDLHLDGGVFNASKDIAIHMDSMYIKGSIYVEDTTINGDLLLAGTYTDSIVDTKDFLHQDGLHNLFLNGFKYEHIYGPIDSQFRIKWLKQNSYEELKPQPWKHLAKVLRDMGHDDDANNIMIAFHDEIQKFKKEKIAQFTREKNIEKCNFINLLSSYTNYLKSLLYLNASYFFKMLYSQTSRYGYRPMRTLFIMFVTWFISGLIYWYSANVAVFAPTNPLVFKDSDSTFKINSMGTPLFASPSEYNHSNNWYYISPGEYTTFQPFWYSLDVILPVVDLQMEKDWNVYIPSPEGKINDLSIFNITSNHFTRWIIWLENLVGWFLSLILVAILSGLAKNEKD